MATARSAKVYTRTVLVRALAALIGKLETVDLTDRERAILDFERNWWNEPGPKEAAIVDRFELSSDRYYRILSELIESPEAEAYDPLVVKRLRRMRDRRRRARIAAATMSESRGR